MITKIDTQTLDFLARKQLTFNQFCMCLMIYHEDAVGIIKYTNEIGFITGGTVMRPDKSIENELDDLLKRKFLVHDDIDKKDWFSLDNFKVTEKFTKGFLDRFDEYAKEFWQIYPKDGMASGSIFVAKSVDYDEYKEKYIKLLKEDISIHELNMERFRKFLQSNKYAEMGIMKYIGSRHYENLTDSNARKIRLH